MRQGYLYVLGHPSDPDLYKIGVTVLSPEKRLAQHNRILTAIAGKVVASTGQEWKLKIYIAVDDVYFAERAFWSATHFPELPGRGGREVERMEWQLVQKGLDAAAKAGVRPGPLRKPPVRDAKWMAEQLEGSGIVMIGRYGGLARGVDFQCGKGHVFRESPGLLANMRTCPCCVDWQCSTGWRAGLRQSLR